LSWSNKTNTQTDTIQTPTDTVIGGAASLEGSITILGDLLIQGTFRGDITCMGNVIVNRGAEVEADIETQCLVVYGAIKGAILVHKRLDIGTTGQIEGDVRAGSARIAEGGVLDGTCAIVPETVEETPAKKWNIFNKETEEETVYED
jgi:cytoskeletal protein CcmA (bactofilin family)